MPKITLLELTEKRCKFPLGHPDEPDFGFCGEPAHPGFPYCVAHCALVYETKEKRASNWRASQRAYPPSR